MAGGKAWGLTGGIGSGKSTAARLLAALGAEVVDADALSRAATAAGGAAMPAIAQAFGPSCLAPDGALERERMRALILSRPEAKRELEAIVHPLVRQGMARAIARSQAPVVICDIPLLAESPQWRNRLCGVVVVECDEALQVQRVCQRNQLPEATVRQWISQQASPEARRRIADVVIRNDTQEIAPLQAQIQALAGRLGLS